MVVRHGRERASTGPQTQHDPVGGPGCYVRLVYWSDHQIAFLNGVTSLPKAARLTRRAMSYKILRSSRAMRLCGAIDVWSVVVAS